MNPRTPHQEPCLVHRSIVTSGMHPLYKDHPVYPDNVHDARPVAMMYRLHEGNDRGPLCYWSMAAQVGGMTLLSR